VKLLEAQVADLKARKPVAAGPVAPSGASFGASERPALLTAER
jgi:hypothetical protein